MKLSQILIEAGVTPSGLHPDCKFIAQDKTTWHVYYYSSKPILDIYEWIRSKDNCKYVYFKGDKIFLKLTIIADDWQTPLSREQFIADYGEYVNEKSSPD
ncbi:hypothetical protein phiPLPE_51 [Iodobacter phage PhiPLPE]|uniref:Uncharacterized protein n=1 Tax=Iodobacter phage PhiPLPE TaxID=551895 RepID=B5AX70_9CAUD|nr:hypothetical protein phiPLPE_51 [Iodobacter phage PhiPLPE]ACG60373.1 hypothetical protein phiPLPE_51 [Iodobacter phage PhiPLPE]